jgi:hypothetical protein
MTTFYCLRFETPPTWRTRSPYLRPSGTGWPSYTPRHLVPFSLPPTVEVLDPASTRDRHLTMSQAQRYFTPRMCSGWWGKHGERVLYNTQGEIFWGYGAYSCRFVTRVRFTNARPREFVLNASPSYLDPPLNRHEAEPAGGGSNRQWKS